jgi:3-hydroxyisobutyrate dehydrogenase
MKAGMIGLGGMGAGMARNLAKAGLLEGVYNRTAATADALAQDLQVTAFKRIADLAGSVDIILLCVSADADVISVVESVRETVRPGTIVVDMSTVSRATALEAAGLLSEKRAFFLDAPVSGGVEGAKNGALAMMVGGDEAVFESAQPVLAAMASRILYMGPTGSGQATKAVNQIMCAGINEAVTEALAFAEAQHLPMDKVIEVIAGGAAGNWFLDKRGLTMTQGIFKPGFKLALHHKDLKICQAMAAEIGAEIPVSEMAIKDYDQLMAEGHGDEDISAMYRLKRRREDQT